MVSEHLGEHTSKLNEKLQGLGYTRTIDEHRKVLFHGETPAGERSMNLIKEFEFNGKDEEAKAILDHLTSFAGDKPQLRFENIMDYLHVFLS